MSQSKNTVSAPPEKQEQTLPFSGEELRKAFSQPNLLISMVLTDYRRLFASFGERQLQLPLACTLFLVTFFFALPYGITVFWDHGSIVDLPAGPLRMAFSWRVPVLYLGSLLICLPSLHIFGAFIGWRRTVMHTLILGLVITAVAAIFTFGFFPILLFLRAIMPSGTSAHALHVISVMLLVVSLVIGIMQQDRGLIRSGVPHANIFLICVWQLLLIYITYRMGWFLELI